MVALRSFESKPYARHYPGDYVGAKLVQVELLVLIMVIGQNDRSRAAPGFGGCTM